jgi:hypothetical protein
MEGVQGLLLKSKNESIKNGMKAQTHGLDTGEGSRLVESLR